MYMNDIYRDVRKAYDSIDALMSIKHWIRDYILTSLCSLLSTVIIIIIPKEVISIIAISKWLLLLLLYLLYRLLNFILRLILLLFEYHLLVFCIMICVEITIYILSSMLLLYWKIIAIRVGMLIVHLIFNFHFCIWWNCFNLLRKLHLWFNRVNCILREEVLTYYFWFIFIAE